MKAKKYKCISHLLIIISLGIIVSAVYLKNLAQNNYVELDSMVGSLKFKNNLKEIELNIKSKCIAFTYFDEETENQMNRVFGIVNNSTEQYNENYFINLELEIFNLQNLLHSRQQKLLFGYDCIFYCSLLLFLIAFLVIIYDLSFEKIEMNKIQTVNNEQLKFSRELHDGVAQDLVALKIYLDKKDNEKSVFYATRALNEVRYLIDSMHTDLTQPLNKTFEETLESFEINHNIKTQFINASENLDKMNMENQMELLRILQESLSNISRHANATEVIIQIVEVGHDLKFNIKDNGVGFAFEDLAHCNKTDLRKHYGVKNIKERVNALGGTVEFINHGGTTIAITIKNFIH